MGYKGTYNGQDWSSLYPKLYRVQYRARIGHREYTTDKVVSAMDEHHARDRAKGSFGSTILGGIEVEFVHTLAKS